MNKPLNILIVDDSADDVFLLEQAFKRTAANSQLQTVHDGLEARAYLKGEGESSTQQAHPLPDVVLLDLNMPRMNGFELLEWLRHDSQCNRIVVHVFTASSREGDIRRAYELGANSYVVKPNRMDDLVSFVAALHQWHRFISLPTRSEQQVFAHRG